MAGRCERKRQAAQVRKWRIRSRIYNRTTKNCCLGEEQQHFSRIVNNVVRSVRTERPDRLIGKRLKSIFRFLCRHSRRFPDVFSSKMFCLFACQLFHLFHFVDVFDRLVMSLVDNVSVFNVKLDRPTTISLSVWRQSTFILKSLFLITQLPKLYLYLHTETNILT